ncbi:VF530 family protein [bacterium]|nr:VF530 family protein [bacterium]
MPDPQPNNPLHGITLEQVVTRLEKRYGWEYLARNININCFKSNPSVKSSLRFLRRTPWARDKVEALYIAAFAKPAAASIKNNSTAAKPTGPWANSLAKIPRKDF